MDYIGRDDVQEFDTIQVGDDVFVVDVVHGESTDEYRSAELVLFTAGSDGVPRPAGRRIMSMRRDAIIRRVQ